MLRTLVASVLVTVALLQTPIGAGAYRSDPGRRDGAPGTHWDGVRAVADSGIYQPKSPVRTGRA